MTFVISTANSRALLIGETLTELSEFLTAIELNESEWKITETDRFDGERVTDDAAKDLFFVLACEEPQVAFSPESVWELRPTPDGEPVLPMSTIISDLVDARKA